jgi:hypothetical protein
MVCRNGALRPRSRTLLALALALAAPIVALGDVVHLKSGQKLEGKILSQRADAIVIQTKFGEMTIERAKIERIETLRLPAEELESRVTSAGNDAGKLWEAAEFARDNKMEARFKELAAKVAKLDATHREANAVLGRVEFEGRFFTPEELEEHKAQIAERMRAQGKELYEGRWVDKAYVMQQKGYLEFEGEWLRPAEIYVKQHAVLGPELLGVTLPTTESAHVSLRSALDPAENAELLEMLEDAHAHFVSIFEPTAVETKIMEYFPTAVYVLPSVDLVAKFVEPGGYMERIYNPPKGIAGRYASGESFEIFFPRPLIVCSEGRHLATGGSRLTSLRGFLSLYYGNMLIRRFKRGGSVPGWIETGMAHFYEARQNEYSTLSIIEFTDFEHVQKWAVGLTNFKEWYGMMAKPEFRAKLPSFESLIDKPAEELDSLDLVKAYFLVRWLMEEDPKTFVAFARRAHQQDSATRIVTPERDALAETFQISPAEIDERFAAWAEKTTAMPPLFR